MGEPVTKKPASLSSILCAVRDPKDLFALCPENEEVQEICKVPEFQRQYLQKNKETVTKYLEKHNFPSNWTNSIMLEGLAALEVTIGLLSMEQNFAALGEALTKFKDKITESDLNSFCLAYGIGFYWIVLFPEQTRISCDEFARNAVSEITKSTNRNELIDEREDIYRYYYNSCFRQAGLKPEMK
jgi:hypothetical protein